MDDTCLQIRNADQNRGSQGMDRGNVRTRNRPMRKGLPVPPQRLAKMQWLVRYDAAIARRQMQGVSPRKTMTQAKQTLRSSGNSATRQAASACRFLVRQGCHASSDFDGDL